MRAGTRSARGISIAIMASYIFITTSIAQADQGASCWEGSQFRQPERMPASDLTNIQKEHLAFLENSELEQRKTLAKNARVLVLFKYWEDVSIISNRACQGYCIGSLMIKRGGVSIVSDVILAADGGVPVDITNVSRDGRYVSSDGGGHHSIEIVFGLLRPDKRSAFRIEKHVAIAELVDITNQGSERHSPSEEKAFSQRTLDVRIVQGDAGFRGIPAGYQECGPFEAYQSKIVNIKEFDGE